MEQVNPHDSLDIHTYIESFSSQKIELHIPRVASVCLKRQELE